MRWNLDTPERSTHVLSWRQVVWAIVIGILSALGGLLGGVLAEYLLDHADREPIIEPVPVYDRINSLLAPGDPGFVEHLEDGCKGDPSWSPCALRLPKPLPIQVIRVDADLCFFVVPDEVTSGTCFSGT